MLSDMFIDAACAGVVAAALADEEVASEQEQGETGDVIHRSVAEGESLLLPLLVEQLRSSLLLEKNCTGCAPQAVPLSHSHSAQISSEEGQLRTVEDSGTESGDNLRLLAVGLRDSIELHRQQSLDISTQKTNSTSGSTEPFGPNLLQEVQTALSRLEASLQLGSIGEGQGEVLDPARREALLQLVSRLQASLCLPAPPDKENLKTNSPKAMLHSQKQTQKFQNKRMLRQNRHTVAVTSEELADARRLVEENSAKDKLISNLGASGTVETAQELVQKSSAGDLALSENTTVMSSIGSPAMLAFHPVHFAPRHSLPGPIFNGNASAKPFFYLSQVRKAGASVNQSQTENQRSSCGDTDTNADNTVISDFNGIHRPLEQSASLGNLCNVSNTTMPEDSNPDGKADFSVLGNEDDPRCTLQKDGDYNQVHPYSDKKVSMQPITAVHREYKPGKLGQEVVRPIQKSVSLDNSSSVTQSVISLAEQAIQKAPVHSSSSSSTASSEASTPLRSDSGTSVPEKTVHKPVSKASSLDSSSSSKRSTPQRSNGGTLIGERVAHKSVPQASAPRRSNSGPSVAEKVLRRSVSQGSAVSSTSDSKVSTPRSDSGSSLPSHHIHKPTVTDSSSPHRAVTQSVSLDTGSSNLAMPQCSAPEHRTVLHSVSLDSDSKDYDPSVLLFTPAQSVQIAVHKAAINKQLSREEEKRQKVNAPSFHNAYNSEDDDSSEVDASSEDEGSPETDEEEEEDNTSTIRQAAVHEKHENEISSNHYHSVKAEDDGHSQTGMKCAQTTALNSCNSKQKVGELESWQASTDVSGNNERNDAGKIPDTSQNTWSTGEDWNRSTAKPNQILQTVQNTNHTIQNPLQNVCKIPDNTETDTSNMNTCITVSSAQRLLQMATKDTKAVVSRSHGRSDRKVKMKRANTIDIPKPLNFYEIEDETDYSSGEEYEGEKNINCGTCSTSDQHRAAYLALRGPIRVGGGNNVLGDKVPPPAFQPKTDSDRKFLAFLQQHSDGKGSVWKGEGGIAKTTSYNPSARGGHHWSSRFTNIKTAFETSVGKDGGDHGRVRNLVSSGPAAARMFWQSADDSVTVMKSAATSGPKLTRQGSNFLRKLFEQKEQEQQSKLPWTEKNVVSDDSVVVGSLTVASSTGSVLSKKQLFTPPQSPATVSAPVNINKFSHAPMSAFRPIDKKQKLDTVNQSVNTNIRQLPTQKFTTTPYLSKQRTGFTHQTKQELLSPVSPTLPWTREGIQQEHRVLNSTVVKFENISRETSPQPSPLPLPRSQSQEKIAVSGNLSVFVQQNATVPAPKSYVSPSHTPGSVQGRYQEKWNVDLSSNSPKQPLHIPTPPMLTAPHLIQNYDTSQQHYHKDHECQDGIHPIEQNLQDKTLEVIPQYCTKSYTTEIDYGNQEICELPDVSPVPQTYSGSVVSKSLAYPQSVNVFTLNSAVQQPDLDSVESPDDSLPSPEAFTAVSRVMAGPTSHQAVTVTQRTRHRFDEMDEANGRSSAAKNLSSVLIKFSSAGENRNLQSTSKQSSSKSPTLALNRKSEDDEVHINKEDFTVNSSKKSPTIDRLRQDARESKQHHLLSKQSLKEIKSPTSPIIRHHSEPDITSMISDEQFMEYQQRLQKKAADHINDSRSPVYRKSENGISESIGYPQHSRGHARGLGQFINTGSVPGLAQESDHHSLVATRVRPASTESLITATSKEELQESGESVLTTRLQFPVYNSSNKVQNLAKSFPNAPRSSSLHDVSVTASPSNNTAASSNTPPSISPSVTLRKSESWHQLVPGQQGIRIKRPQSLALPDLTIPSGNICRIPPALPKTKSSHSLSFPKQFEATLSPESVENKQRKVEAYLKSSAKPKTQEVKMNAQKSQGNSVLPSSELLVLGDNLENVDEAFENVFNAAISGNSETTSKRNTTHKTKRLLRQPATEEHIPSHLSRSTSSQFVRKQQAWEDSSMVRTKLAHHLSSK